MTATAVAGTPPEPRARAPGQRWFQAVLVLVPLVIAAVTGWAHRWIADDGFIYLRVVHQVTGGNGPVFNTGERVEAFTGPMWLALLSVADLAAPMRLEWIAVGLGLALSVGGIALAMAGAAQFSRTEAPDALLVPFGALVFVVVVPVWFFETSGLESGLTFAWLGASLLILARWSRAPARTMPLPGAVVLGLGWLVRPELVVFSAAFLILLLALQWQGGWRSRVLLVVAFVAVPFVYQVFRMGYYGSLVATTAIAKEGTRVRWDRGWNYFRDFSGPYWLWVPGLVLALAAYLPLLTGLHRRRARRAEWVVVAFVVGGVLDALYVIAVGGDYMHGRLFLPALFAVCAPVALLPATRRYLASLAIAPWIVASAFFLRPPELDRDRGFAGTGFVLTNDWGKVSLAELGWGPDSDKRAWYTGPAYYDEVSAFTAAYRRVDLPLRPDVDLPIVAMGGIGLVSYAMGTDLNILDIYGLADPFAAHLRPEKNLGFVPPPAGHEKPLPQAWVAARLTPRGVTPAPDDFPVGTFPLIEPTKGAKFQEQVAWARAVLECREIRQLMRASDPPLTVGRFASNFFHSFGNTRLRIPADPEEAYRKFCGSDIPSEVQELTGKSAR